jgi:anhydro-N-acetylmuramic acid kinase
MLVLGIMSGTSIDGVDYALCEVTSRSVKLVKLWSRPFPKALRARLHAAAANECSAHELAQLHHDLGRLYAEQAKRLGARAKLVGLHGQTIFHNPNRRPPATLQIGEPAYLAEALRVPVVSNFRAADIAAGGQGAPLATMFHQVVFARRGQHVCVNNLGGISNVTSLDWRRGREPRVLAFDTGPANVLLDLAVRDMSGGKRSFDKNGALAASGDVDENILRHWLKHPFFRSSPPKSTGREEFGEIFWKGAKRFMRGKNFADVLRCLTELTARSIVVNYREHLPAIPDVVVLCGGGARNTFLVQRLRALLAVERTGVEVATSADWGWPATAIEPAAFALLAFRRWKQQAGNLPQTTGAGRLAVLGSLSVP